MSVYDNVITGYKIAWQNSKGEIVPAQTEEIMHKRFTNETLCEIYCKGLNDATKAMRENCAKLLNKNVCKYVCVKI